MTLDDDLAAAGFDRSAGIALHEWVATRRDVVPILIHWLVLVDDPQRANASARALTFRWAREAYDPLVDALPLFTERSRSDSVEHPERWANAAWAVGNAIDVLWRDDRFDELAGFVRDPTNGKARQMVLYGMRKSKRPEAADVAASLVEDPEMRLHAISVLMKHPSEQARAGLERLLGLPVVGVKARKALERLDERTKS